MRRRTDHITHGQCRRWRVFWRKACRCGMDAWPCPVVVMLELQARPHTTRPRAPQPVWNQPTRRLNELPLMTRGQAARSRQSGRW